MRDRARSGGVLVVDEPKERRRSRARRIDERNHIEEQRGVRRSRHARKPTARE
jgi:hypothetical protein